MSNLTRRSPSAVYVGNLHPEATEQELGDFFSQIGPVASVKIMRMPDTHESKGFCFIEYNNIQLAEIAVKRMNKVNFRGRPLRVGSNMIISNHAIDKGTPELMKVAQQLKVEQSAPMPAPMQPPLPEQQQPLIGGMSVKELYGIMSEMKKIVQQNPEQARQILVAKPAMTRSLFHAQMRLGMIKPSQSEPSQVGAQANLTPAERMQQNEVFQQNQQSNMFPQQQIHPQQMPQQQFQQQAFHQQQSQQQHEPFQQQQFAGFPQQQGGFGEPVQNQRMNTNMPMNQPEMYPDNSWSYRGDDNSGSQSAFPGGQGTNPMGSDVSARVDNAHMQGAPMTKQENIDAGQQNALLQQVLQMTPDMIERLRPDQRAQVEKLRQLAQAQSMNF